MMLKGVQVQPLSSVRSPSEQSGCGQFACDHGQQVSPAVSLTSALGWTGVWIDVQGAQSGQQRYS